jgi:hypothetical protein
MNKRIYKYELAITDSQTVTMPEGAEILAVQVQRGAPCLWALVNPELRAVERHIETFGTGHPVDTGVERLYIGTYQISGGSLVFHVFEPTPVIAGKGELMATTNEMRNYVSSLLAEPVYEGGATENGISVRFLMRLNLLAYKVGLEGYSAENPFVMEALAALGETEICPVCKNEVPIDSLYSYNNVPNAFCQQCVDSGKV